MEFIKILFNIAFTVLPLLLLLLLQQIPAARSTITQRSTTENKFQNAETSTIATKISQTTTKTTATPTIITTTTTTTINNKNKNNITTTTTTRALRKQEQIIDNSIDFAVDPCDDFYQYACGEWKQQLYEYNDEDTDAEDKSTERVFGANEAEQSVNDDADAESDKYDRTLAMIDYLADKEVLRYFNVRNMTKNLNTTTTSTAGSQTTTTKEPDFIIKVYKYYKSCIAIQQYEPIKYLEWLELNEHVKWPSLINTTTANSKEHDAHKHDHAAVAEVAGEEVDEIIMDDDDDDDAVDADDEAEESESGDDDNNEEPAQDYDSSWITTLAILRKYGMNGIFIEEVIYNTKSLPSKMFLGFNKPIKQGGFKSLKSDHLKIVLNNLKLQFSEDSFKKLWLQVTKFEWELTKLNDLGDELGTVIIPISHLPVSWLVDYLRVILQQTKPLDSSMRIVLTNAGYFMALNELLNEYENNFLNQYLQIRFLWHLYQQEPQTFQPLDCILHIKHYMPLAFEWIFEQQNQHLHEEIPKIQDLYSNLRRQFNLTLYTNKNNFDSATLDHFVKKLESIQLNVGSFVDIDRSKFFYENRKFYSHLILSSREFFSNHLKMLKFNFNSLHFGMRTVNTYSHYYDMQEYNRGLTSAPHFNKRLNILHIPLSLLQPPLYHKDFTDIYKYSSMGFILAQTLMYSFNLNGLAAAEHPKLFKHLKCLGSWDSAEVNDKIADVSGFRLAYHSFFQAHANTLVSNRKKFFLNFAQSFCGASRSSDDDLGRSPVNYALAQFSEFAKTFECSPDSHMHPHEKCYLWD
ncbi:uncharacterized protein LOC135952654 [Calliphora vicina]|uniref:uncharacterized protein LOC135952654 n=1 Tax=Calliphora vicina TaxID=7373 RepID=UPI00325A5650